MSASSQSDEGRRWPGVVLSLLVPGFGVLRGGFGWRAAGWFFGLWLAFLAVWLAFALGAIPGFLVVIGAAAVFVGYLWMLVDGFRPGRMSFRLWLVFAALFAVVWILPSPAVLVGGRYVVGSGSMEPSLLGPESARVADHLMVDLLTYRFASPQRGDLIMVSPSGIPRFPMPEGGELDGGYFIMRLVGLPGERIRISGGNVYADGRLLGEMDGIPSSINYVDRVDRSGGTRSVGRDGEEYVVGEEEVFVLGDNSPSSFDSRYWGGVPVSAVYGRASRIYWPRDRAGRIGR